MTQVLSLISAVQLGQGAIMEDIDPTPHEFRATQGATSEAPVEAEKPIDSQDDKPLSSPTQESISI